MNILLISDDPTSESFRQILSLKREIEGITRKRVDLITFSDDEVSLNQKQVVKKPIERDSFITLETILKREAYFLLIISLRLKFLKLLFPDGENILDLIEKTSSDVTVFIFGAESALKNVRKEQRKLSIFLNPRHGVAKLTQEFKNKIITYLESQL